MVQQHPHNLILQGPHRRLWGVVVACRPCWTRTTQVQSYESHKSCAKYQVRPACRLRHQLVQQLHTTWYTHVSVCTPPVHSTAPPHRSESQHLGSGSWQMTSASVGLTMLHLAMSMVSHIAPTKSLAAGTSSPTARSTGAGSSRSCLRQTVSFSFCHP